MRQEIKDRVEKIRNGEVPEGYIIDSGIFGPKSWALCCLNDCGKWVGGGTPFKGNKSYWENGHIPWATSQDISEGTLTSAKYQITDIAIKESTTNIIPTHSIVIVMRSGILRHSLPVMKTAAEIAINQDLKALIVNEKCYFEYVYYLLRNEEKKVLNDCVKTGTTVESVDFASLKRVKLLLPPVAEQQKIATVLSTWDKVIELKEQLIEQKKKLMRELMKKLLTGEMRLPGFTGERKKVKLGTIGSFLKGKGLSKSEVIDKGIPCIRYGEIYTTHDNFIKGFKSFVSRSVAMTSERIYKGDILFAGSGETQEEIGKSVAYVDDDEAYAGGDIVILRPKRCNSIYLGYALNVEHFNTQKRKLGQGHSVVHIYSKDLKELSIHLPELAEQEKIAEVLKKSDQEINLLQQKLEALKLQKKGLMQLLLTGIVRVEN